MGLIKSLFGKGKREAGPPKSPGLSDIYTGLRNQVFQARTTNGVWDVAAVIMETGYPQAIVTLVAMADGTTSLYFSNGGGIIGAGEHESVRSAASALLRLAAQYAGEMVETEQFPLPSVGRVRFYVVTSDRVLMADSAEEDLGYDRATLSPLFHEGHKVMYAVQEHAPR